MKYIIDIPKTVGMTEKVGSVHYTYFDGIQCQTIILKSDEIEEFNSDYINEHYGSLQDDAYQRGYKDCETRYCSFDACPNRQAEYQRGLKDGKAVSDKGCEGCKYVGRAAVEEPCVSCSNSYKNKWTAMDDKIAVGDIVNLKDASLDKENGIVTKIWDNDYCYIVWSDGSGGSWAKNMLVKTGKHIDIASILEDMRND